MNWKDTWRSSEGGIEARQRIQGGDRKRGKEIYKKERVRNKEKKLNYFYILCSRNIKVERPIDELKVNHHKCKKKKK